MRIDNLRHDPMSKGNVLRMQDQSEPMDVSPVRPSIPQDHLEPSSGAMRRLDEKLKRQDFMLEELARAKRSALEWKTLWLCEVMRGDHEFEETYRVAELDRAREKIEFWDKESDSIGNITVRYDS